MYYLLATLFMDASIDKVVNREQLQYTCTLLLNIGPSFSNEKKILYVGELENCSTVNQYISDNL